MSIRPRGVRTCAALAAASALALGLVGGPPSALASPETPRRPGGAAVQATEVVAVPPTGALALTGHGYGHGRGMSQYGAQGAAIRGMSAAQILSFYYPGTTLSSTGGVLRVRLTGDADADVRVLPAPGLAVRDLRTGNTATLPAGPTLWRLHPGGSGTVLDHLQGGSWVVDGSFAGDAEFFGPPVLTLRTPTGDVAYRGALRLTTGSSGARDSVNVVGIEEYLRGVVPREMPASWRPAAVQSQAVAARTYAAFERAVAGGRTWDLCDTTACQVYGGVGSEAAGADAAIAATAGTIVTHGGAPAFTQFSSSSGGWTVAGTRPYLVSQPDPYDDFAGNPVHTWNTSLTAAAVQRAYPRVGVLHQMAVTRRDGHGDLGGRVVSLSLQGSAGQVTVSGSAFRAALGLRSDWFAFTGATQVARSPIASRWRAIGGPRSRVGRPRGPERGIAGGRVRDYRRGAIFWSPTTGARELFGPALRTYRRSGGPTARLGFPLTRPRQAGRAVVVRFEHGRISCRGPRCRIR